MAWFAAQLKAAEGLLEAVDKTVSKTVGTLGLAEGEAELSGEYAYPRAGGQAQPSAGASPYTSVASGAVASQYAPPTSYGASTSSNYSSGYGDFATSRPPAGVSAASPWDSRAAAPPVGLNTEGSIGSGDHGGFTVKSDAPIPFGSRPPQTPATATTFTTHNSISRNSSYAALGGGSAGTGSAGVPTHGATTASGNMPGVAVSAARPMVGPYGAAAAAPSPSPAAPHYSAAAFTGSSATVTGGTDLGISRIGGAAAPAPHAAAAPAAPLVSTPAQQPVGTASEAAAPARAASGEPPHGAAVVGTSRQGSSSSGSGGALDNAQRTLEPPSRTGALGPSTPGGNGQQGDALGSSGQQSQWQSGVSAPAEAAAGLSAARGLGAGTRAAGTGAPAAAVAAPAAQATGASEEGAAGASNRHPASALTDGGASNGPASVTSNEPADGVASFAPEAAQRSASGGAAASAPRGGASTAASAAAATLASATTAAASTLASATTTAVTHSLSFFNLVTDDPDNTAAAAAATSSSAAAAGDAAAGGAAAAQVAALTRTCDQLRKRLESSRAENEQLEDMLARAEVRVQQEAALVASLRAELATAASARAAAEGSLAAQLAAARASLGETSDRYEAAQRRLLLLEGQLAALEESSKRLMEAHTDREGDMLEALRGELSACEARLAAERKAAAASRAAAAAREADLEAQIAGSSAALADLTRGLEEASRKGRALEEEVLVATRDRNELSTQLAALRERLAAAGLDDGTHAHAGLDGALRSPGGGGAAAAAAAELELLRAELAQQRRATEAAAKAADASAAQAAALAAEVESLRQGAEQHKDTAALEAQLREASDMLYLKQTQLERLAAEKAAQQIKTERELEAARQELAKLSRQLAQQGGGGSGGSGSSLSLSSAPHDVIPMDALGEPYQRLTRHSRVGRAVKAAASLLDSTAATTSFVLRQYPLARLAVFGYVLLIHSYVYMLLARMQRLATQHEAAAAAPARAL